MGVVSSQKFLVIGYSSLVAFLTLKDNHNTLIARGRLNSANSQLISPPITAEQAVSAKPEAGQRASKIIGQVIFFSLLLLLLLTAIPYGTAQIWWKAVFVGLAFTLAILWTIEGLFKGSWATGAGSLLLPPIILAAFSIIQTIPLRSAQGAIGGINGSLWYAISADPQATRFFVLQLLGLTISGALLFRYASSEAHVRTLIHVVVGVAVASAYFGLLRQTTQHGIGFGLPLMQPDVGYGKFINRNHFAFLMEMAFGLGLGMIVGRGLKRERAVIYFAFLLPIWTALVLSNSRGGLVAMFAQLIVAALLFPFVSHRHRKSELARIAQSLPVRLALLVVLVMALALGALWLGGDRLITRLAQGTAEYDPATLEMRQGGYRNQMWKATWQMFLAHPIAGVGMGGYWAAIPTYHDASGTLTPQEAHNDYLELLASGGLVGLAIAVWFAVLLLRRIRTNLQSRDHFRRATTFAASIGITGAAVHSLFDFGLHLTVNALVFTVLLVIASCRARREARATTHA